MKKHDSNLYTDQVTRSVLVVRGLCRLHEVIDSNLSATIVNKLIQRPNNPTTHPQRKNVDRNSLIEWDIYKQAKIIPNPDE